MLKTAEKLYKIENGQLVEVELPKIQAVGTKRAYGVEEARTMLGLGRNKFIELLLAGEIRSKKVGSKWIIPANAIDEFLAQ